MCISTENISFHLIHDCSVLANISLEFILKGYIKVDKNDDTTYDTRKLANTTVPQHLGTMVIDALGIHIRETNRMNQCIAQFA